MTAEAPIDHTASNLEKIKLFRSIFAGRQDVFARRYENKKKGTSGYAPCCQNQWGAGCVLKQHKKCSECPVRQHIPISDEAVRWHLRGKDADMKPFVMGIYPMEADETVRVAVIDFDESSWRRDALFTVRKARVLGLSVALERSRSGKGAHLWFFLQTSVPAKSIREVLTYVMTRVIEEHPEVSLGSYDRIIPNQDTLPKGGFGNLIALPLQAEPRKMDNSVFVNDDWVPYTDQWAYLSSVERISRNTVDLLLQKARNGRRLLLPNARTVSDSERPWTFFLPLWSTGEHVGRSSALPLLADVRVVLANRVYVEQKNLTPSVRCKLIALASFHNPEFTKKQRMKYSVYGEPRIISRALNGEEFLQVPRGCFDSVLQTLKGERFNPVVEDKRYAGVPIEMTFKGTLRIDQKSAVADLKKSDAGILAAGTAFGKTVVAVYMIAERKVNTLVLVNRRQLQLQWIARLAEFLGIPEKEIGRVGCGAKRWTGKVDVAVIQSLSRKGVVDPRVKEYGQIIVDECHAVASETFEAAVDTAPAKYVLGLSATVERQDGQHPLIMMQCGPVRHRVDPKTLAKREPFDHIVYVRPTSFRMPMGKIGEDGHVEYSDLCDALVADASRNRQIAQDVLSVVAEGRSPVVLSDRRDQVEELARLLDGRVRHILLLMGGLGRRQLKAERERLVSIPAAESRVILATGSFLGEGFDDARLDTLFLAQPISWRGRLTQFAGRLHRLCDGKKEVRIYDYLDVNVAVCSRMYDRRAKGYGAIGYKVVVPVGVSEGWPVSVALPAIPHWKETFSDSVRRLCRDGVDEALADLFVYATLQFDLGERVVGRPDASAAVLKFLYERLESRSETRGLFQSGCRLPIPCGENPYVEAALVHQKAKVVISFDSVSRIGDIEVYRRTRREDVLLQQNGYRVLRFLVEDVCEHLDDVLDTIVASVPSPPRRAPSRS
ncbi:MAG: TOTE conflict system archaeo-eukaryotic primase domain-containing protein [Kiritimatiellia bacterium]